MRKTKTKNRKSEIFAKASPFRKSALRLWQVALKSWQIALRLWQVALSFWRSPQIFSALSFYCLEGEVFRGRWDSNYSGLGDGLKKARRIWVRRAWLLECVSIIFYRWSRLGYLVLRRCCRRRRRCQ